MYLTVQFMPMGVHRLLTICLENYSFQTVFRELHRPPPFQASIGGGGMRACWKERVEG